MSIDFSSAWTVAEHLVELIAAHGLMDASKSAFAGVRSWLIDHLPQSDKAKLAAVEHNPAPGPERAELALVLYAMLKDNPKLLDELRTMLQQAAGGTVQVMTLGNDNRGVIQNDSGSVSVSISD